MKEMFKELIERQKMVDKEEVVKKYNELYDNLLWKSFGFKLEEGDDSVEIWSNWTQSLDEVEALLKALGDYMVDWECDEHPCEVPSMFWIGDRYSIEIAYRSYSEAGYEEYTIEDIIIRDRFQYDNCGYKEIGSIEELLESIGMGISEEAIEDENFEYGWWRG